MGLKVSVSWFGPHPSISIENSSNPTFNGRYDFGPDVDLSNVVPWLAGFSVDGQVGYGASPVEGNVIYESDFMDEIIYNRIMEDFINPPDYSWIQYNCMDWVNDMLYGTEEDECL